MSASPCANCTGETFIWHGGQTTNTRVSSVHPSFYIPGQRTTLLSLPPEIRGRIWRFVFKLEPTYPAQQCKICGSATFQSLRVEIKHAPHKAATESVLATLRTCRTLNAEASHLFYSCNLLSVSSPAALYHLLSTLPPRHRESIAALHVAGMSPCHWTTTQIAPQAFSLLSLCSRLEDMFVDFAIDETGDERLEPLLASVFQNNDELWDQDYFETSSEYEEFSFCKAFLALSQQRNLKHLGFRARYSESPLGSNLSKAIEWVKPYSYEDIVFKELTGASVDLLRAQTRQARLKPTTRFERAHASAQKQAQRQPLDQSSHSDDQDAVSIRPMNSKEIRQEQDYTKQKALVKYLFDHGVSEPCCRGDAHNF